MTHSDYTLETDGGFLAVIEHRSVPARVRNAWAGLRRTGIRSVWAPGNQESGHVGHAVVGFALRVHRCLFPPLLLRLLRVVLLSVGL